MTLKITNEEPWGPLRTGLKELSESLGPNGGSVFAAGLDIANAGLDAVLAMEAHNLGDSDRSIPRTYHAVKVERDRGAFQAEVAEKDKGALRL